MENFSYENKSKLIFGNNDEAVLANEILARGAKKVLLHYGQNSVIKSGLLERIKFALNKAGIAFVEYGGVSANPLRIHALAGVDIAKSNGVDFVLAIGGGSVIDSAKLICAGALNPDIWSYYNWAKFERPLAGALPLGVVLTIPAAGSEQSTGSVIKDERDGLKYSYANDALRSQFAFINPQYCLSLPQNQIAFGSADILAHLLERYFSPEQNVTVTDKILGGAINSVLEIAPKVYAKATYENMAELCLIGTLAHNGMLALGRVIQAWESHPIEMMTLSGEHNVAHGQGLAIIYPAWLKYMSQKNPSKVLQFAREVMNVNGKSDAEIMKNGIEKLTNFFKSLGLATTYAELGFDVNNAIETARKAFPANICLGGYGKLNLTDIENVIKLAGGTK